MRAKIDYLLNEETIVSRWILLVVNVLLISLLLVALGWISPGAPVPPAGDATMTTTAYPGAVLGDEVLARYGVAQEEPSPPAKSRAARNRATKPVTPPTNPAETIRSEIITKDFSPEALALFKGEDWASDNLCDIAQRANWAQFEGQMRYLVVTGKGGCGLIARAEARSPVIWKLGALQGWLILIALFALCAGVLLGSAWIWIAKKNYHWLYRSRVYRPSGHR